jgi:hypothetical protein
MTAETSIDVVRREAFAFELVVDGQDPLIESIGDASLVLLGEASHGTHEFYQTRAALTRALIERKGFKSSPLKRTGPTRTASTGGSGTSLRRAASTKHLAIFVGFLAGCGATAMSSTSCSGCAATTKRVTQCHAWVFTESISAASTRRSRPF